MKRIEYTGKKPLNIGRFGLIERGAKLEMFEIEWDALTGDDRFKLLDNPPTEREELAASLIWPLHVPQFFDLRSIPWSSTKLHNQLLARFSRKSCGLVISAMNVLGCNIDTENSERRDVRVDRIIAASRKCGWDSLSVNDARSFGVWSESLGDQEGGGADSKQGSEPEVKHAKVFLPQKGGPKLVKAKPVRKRTRKPAAIK